jgi:hypothetical protein
MFACYAGIRGCHAESQANSPFRSRHRCQWSRVPTPRPQPESGRRILPKKISRCASQFRAFAVSYWKRMTSIGWNNLVGLFDDMRHGALQGLGYDIPGCHLKNHATFRCAKDWRSQTATSKCRSILLGAAVHEDWFRARLSALQLVAGRQNHRRQDRRRSLADRLPFC